YITINDGFQDQYYEVLEDAFYVLKKDSKLQITPYDRSFESKTLLQRFLTLVAGPFMNFILAIVLYLLVSFVTGVPNYDSNVVGSVSTANTSMLVEEDGKITTKLQKGDKILEVNGKAVATWTELSKELDKLLESATTKVQFKIERASEQQVIEMECYTYIVSLGISNMQVKEEEFPSGVTHGVRLGAIGIRYLDDGKKGDYPIQSGDILTKIRMKKVKSDETIEKDIESWDQLIALFKDADIVNVQFEYYSYKKEGIVSLDDCAMLQTYGNDVLDNQRIDKIQVKVGFSPVMKFDFFKCIGNAFVDFWNDFTLIFRTLGLLIFPGRSGIRQVGVNDLSSFVGIFDLIK
ncbi:MAG: M50 family metallopeptidase, partial [Anaeroplasmataceae bacterium]|nr:M50 family metallopeptidase [Anaeroplasmataceae bacterium]